MHQRASGTANRYVRHFPARILIKDQDARILPDLSASAVPPVHSACRQGNGCAQFGKFGIPALSSGFFNITSVVAGLLLGFAVGSRLGIEPIVGIAIGTLLGGGVQYICQIPALRRTGLRFRPMVGMILASAKCCVSWARARSGRRPCSST